MIIDIIFWTFIIYGMILVIGKIWPICIAYIIEKILIIFDFLKKEINKFKTKNRIDKL